MMNKGNKNGRPMAYMAPKYHGPTVGEKLEIDRISLEIASEALKRIQTYSDDPVVTRMAREALKGIKKAEGSWEKKL